MNATGEQKLTLSSLEHLWGSSPRNSFTPATLCLATIHPYEYSFSQAGRLTVTYNTRYPLPLTSAQEAAREADFQRIKQTYLSFTRYSWVVEDLANLFLDKPCFYVKADPALPLSCTKQVWYSEHGR